MKRMIGLCWVVMFQVGYAATDQKMCDTAYYAVSPTILTAAKRPILYAVPLDAAFKRRIRHEAQQGRIDFAGKYQVISRGCGTDCYEAVILDHTSGKVYPLPTTLTANARVSPHSRLMIAYAPETPIDETHGHQRYGYLLWDESHQRFVALDVCESER